MKFIILSSLLLCLKVSCTHASEGFSCKTNITEEYLSKYCMEKNCVAKCCGINEFLYIPQNGIYMCKPFSALYNDTTSFSDIFTDNNLPKIDTFTYYQLDENNTINIVTTKSFSDQFNLLHNGISFYYNYTSDCYLSPKYDSYSSASVFVLQNGSLLATSDNSMMIAEPLTFCVDIAMGITKPGNEPITLNLVFQMESVNTTKAVFIVCALLISSFFIILVLLVYSVLPQLRTLGGMLLMAYLSTLLTGNLIKAASTIQNILDRPNPDLCRYYITPLLYYFIMSSFMWLNVMSFDMWRTFRAEFYQLAIHRQGELVKFLWYAFAAIGIAAAMTTIMELIDKHANWENLPFKNCFHNNEADRIYLFAPMSFLTTCNVMFFLMTVFNIWRIKKNIRKMNKASLCKNSKTFRSFMKISLLMGVSWILETIDAFIDNTPDWLYIIINLYNGCIGVVFFLFFVCNKDILTKLCRRFNIKNKFIENKLNSSTRTTVSRPSVKRSYSRAKANEDILELSEDPTSQSKI